MYRRDVKFSDKQEQSFFEEKDLCPLHPLVLSRSIVLVGTFLSYQKQA